MKKNTLSARSAVCCVSTGLALLALLAGCASSTPHYDQYFGDAVRQSRSEMTIDPDAGSTAGDALGMDGTAAREALGHYQSTFKTPPPVTNVISIGGSR